MIQEYLDFDGLKKYHRENINIMDEKDYEILNSSKEYADELAKNLNVDIQTKVNELANGQVNDNTDAIKKLNGDTNVESSVDNKIAKAKNELIVDIKEAKEVGNDAKAIANQNAKDIGDVDILKTKDKTLVGSINEVLEMANNNGVASVLTISTEKTSEGAVKSYTFKQGDTNIGTVDIPKDIVVESGEVVTNPKGQVAGTYIKLVLANVSEPLYINVGTLVDIYKAKANATQIQISIDSATREISATIVAGSVGSNEIANNAITTVKIADANITLSKLATTIQSSLSKADSAILSITEGATNGTIKVDGKDVKVHGLGSAAYKDEAVFDTVGSADAVQENLDKEIARASGVESGLDERVKTMETFWAAAQSDGTDKDVIDTLKEIQDYIASDESGASAMLSSINKNSEDITKLEAKKLNLPRDVSGNVLNGELGQTLVSNGNGSTTWHTTSNADWDVTNTTSKEYIKNKPPVTKGTGKDSVVIGVGDARGDYSVAGGSSNSAEIDKFKNMASLAGYTVDTDSATSYGDGSLSLGLGTKSYSIGSIAIGISNSAGAKGFYWHSIDWSGVNPVIQLTTEQKPYYYYKMPIIGTKISVNETATWNTEASNILANWAVGDVLTIVNNIKYGEKTIITAIDSATGKITVESLPFTSNDVKIEYSSLSDITSLILAFDDYSIYIPEKPYAGMIEFAYEALSLGALTNAAGSFSSAIGFDTKVTTDFGHAEGRETVADYAAHAEGYKTKAIGLYSHSEGDRTTANGGSSHSEGSRTTANGGSSHSEGSRTTASGNYSHAEGNETTANGESSHAEGRNTVASNTASHAEGYGTTASGEHSHAEGYGTTASERTAHAEGYNVVASERYAHAEGRDTVASGRYTHVEGYGTIAKGRNSHVQGKYNVEDADNKYAHIVGNGSADVRSNAHTVDWHGNAWYAGDVYVSGTNQDDTEAKKLATVDYVDSKISDIKSALDSIIAIQNALVGGDSV